MILIKERQKSAVSHPPAGPPSQPTELHAPQGQRHRKVQFYAFPPALFRQHRYSCLGIPNSPWVEGGSH